MSTQASQTNLSLASDATVAQPSFAGAPRILPYNFTATQSFLFCYQAFSEAKSSPCATQTVPSLSHAAWTVTH